MSSRSLRSHVLLAAWLVGAFVLDLVLPIRHLPLASVYAVPVLLAATRLPPRSVASLAGAALGLYALDLALDQRPLLEAGLHWLSLVPVAYLSYLAAQRVQEAETARRQLQHYFGMVAHDLRGPLTAILGYAQLLQRPALAPTISERSATAIQLAARRLDRLLSDLVDAARVGAGTFVVNPRPMDLVALARRVVEAQQLSTDRHRIALEAPDRLEGCWDPDRVEQVLDNLVANAIKYSPNGGEIRVCVRRQGRWALVSVADRGLGIRPEDLPRLFQPFSRLAAPEIQGAGLGLYITRSIVEAHRGRIWMRSAGPEQGSTFSVALPLPDQARALSSPPQPRARPHRSRAASASAWLTGNE